jgi:hypothetical protein
LLSAFEVKWKLQKTPKVPAAFAKAYPSADFGVITEANYLEWIGG